MYAYSMYSNREKTGLGLIPEEKPDTDPVAREQTPSPQDFYRLSH